MHSQLLLHPQQHFNIINLFNISDCLMYMYHSVLKNNKRKIIILTSVTEASMFYHLCHAITLYSSLLHLKRFLSVS